jgi:hypothetical protein
MRRGKEAKGVEIDVGGGARLRAMRFHQSRLAIAVNQEGVGVACPEGTGNGGRSRRIAIAVWVDLSGSFKLNTRMCPVAQSKSILSSRAPIPHQANGCPAAEGGGWRNGAESLVGFTGEF